MNAARLAEAKPAERFLGEAAVSQALGQTPKPSPLDRARVIVNRLKALAPEGDIDVKNVGRIVASQLMISNKEGEDLVKQVLQEKTPTPEQKQEEPEASGEEPEEELSVELVVDVVVTDKTGKENCKSLTIPVPYGGRLSIRVDGTEVHKEDAPEEVA